MDLDTLLDRAAPPLADRTPGLKAALGELVLAAQPVARRRRRRVALAGGAVGLVTAVAVGGAAAAGVGFPAGVFGWTSEEGTSCVVGVTFEPVTPGEVGYTTGQEPALAEARRWVAAFDIASVDRATAADQWLSHMEEISADQPTRRELEDIFQGDDLESHALSHEVYRQFEEHMTAEGYDTRPLNPAVAVGCGER